MEQKQISTWELAGPLYLTDHLGKTGKRITILGWSKSLLIVLSTDHLGESIMENDMIPQHG